jgi:hypothetical protein|tara:strand:+ start:489 stop:758 length:270 start_codon:yes stop_codon:yes gene_type:complete
MSFITFYQHSDNSAPMALVRYTIMGDDNKVIDVQELKYDYTPTQLSELQQEITTAIECDIEVLIFTRRNLKDFPDLNAYLESLGYYSKN